MGGHSALCSPLCLYSANSYTGFCNALPKQAQEVNHIDELRLSELMRLRFRVFGQNLPLQASIWLRI